jgi:hypothetical protein
MIRTVDDDPARTRKPGQKYDPLHADSSRTRL